MGVGESYLEVYAHLNDPPVRGLHHGQSPGAKSTVTVRAPESREAKGVVCPSQAGKIHERRYPLAPPSFHQQSEQHWVSSNVATYPVEGAWMVSVPTAAAQMQRMSSPGKLPLDKSP